MYWLFSFLDDLTARIIFNLCDLSVLKRSILHEDTSDSEIELLNETVQNSSGN